MSELPTIPAAGSDATRSSERVQSSRRADAASGPAFEVLLERLASRAAELEEKKRTLATPEQVGAAVDVARASLEEALSLGERLIEVYRQAQAQRPNGAEVQP